MKKLILLVVALTTVFISNAQTLKEYKGGHVFTVGLPDYMTRKVGLNDVASIQYKSDEKDVAGFVISDTKEELQLAALSFSSVRGLARVPLSAAATVSNSSKPAAVVPRAT